MRSILLLLFVSISYALVLEREDKPILKHSNVREIIHTSTSKGFFHVPYHFEVNSDMELTYQYTNLSQLLLNRSAKIVVETVDATNSNPVLIVVRQKKDVMSWQHPLIISSHAGVKAEYQKVSRTICPSKFYSSDAFEFTEDENLLVTASTSSLVNVTVRLTVEFVDDFYLSLSEDKYITVSPSQPSFYGYLFSNDTETIFLAVNSEDQACITVSVQNIDCPIYDLEKNVKYEGKWETMIHKGGMTLKIDRNQIGFFVVFVVNSYDDECSGLPGSGDQDHQSTLSFILTPGLSENEYDTAIYIIPGTTYSLFCIVFLVLMGYKLRNIDCSKICKCFRQEDKTTGTQNSRTQQQIPASENANSANGNERKISEELVLVAWKKLAIKQFQDASKKKSHFYVWITISAAIFYFVPSVQRVVTHLLVLHETGNQDLCYYNFHCAHPYGKLSDYNHVISNIGYLVLGLLFIFITIAHHLVYADDIDRTGEEIGIKTYNNYRTESSTYPLAVDHQDRNDEEGKEFSKDSASNQRKADETRKGSSSEAESMLKKTDADIAAGASSSHQTTELENPGCSSGAINRSSKDIERANTAGDRNTAESHSKVSFKNVCLKDHHKNLEKYLHDKFICEQKDTEKYRQYKLPQHFGLFYAMGFALMAEGFLSGAYHICPRSSNFQFDTTFMYVTAVLCMVKIYKNRNQEVYANATATFIFLAIVTFIVMLNNIVPSIYLSPFIASCQILISLVISVPLYYLGDTSKGWNHIKSVFYLVGCCQFKCSESIDCGKLALPVSVIFINVVIAILGLCCEKLREVATYVLVIFIVNLIVFFGFYVIKKCKHFCLCCDKIDRTGEEKVIKTDNNDPVESSTFPLAVDHQDRNDEEGKEFSKDSASNQRKADETRKGSSSEAESMLKKTDADKAAGASSSHQTTELENPGCSSGAINRSSKDIERANTAGDRNTAESHSKKCCKYVSCKCFEPNVYLIISALLWVPALYFLFSSSTSWEETPAISRDRNQGCIFLNFYDKHDLWHFLSAGGLFFTFMALLTLNDHLIETP